MPSRSPRLDPDAAALAGCTTFVVVSFVCLGISISPWVFMGQPGSLEDIAVCLAKGFLPSAVVGILAGRFRGCAGGGAFGGGMFAAALFIGLRLEQIRLTAIADQADALIFPRALAWVTALGWTLLSCIVSLIAVAKKEFPSDETRKQP